MYLNGHAHHHDRLRILHPDGPTLTHREMLASLKNVSTNGVFLNRMLLRTQPPIGKANLLTIPRPQQRGRRTADQLIKKWS